MGKVLEAQLVISGTDKTGGAFAGVIKHAQELKKTLDGMGGMGLNDARMRDASKELRAQTRLLREQSAAVRAINTAFAQGNKEIEHRSRMMTRMRELGQLGSLAGLKIANDASQFGRASLQTYREFDKERRFGKAVMGLTDEQQAPLVKQAIHMGATSKFNDIQVLEAQRELAARGLNVDQVQGLIAPASNLGQALDLHLPEAVRQLEGALFGFKRDLSTSGAALASAAKTADLQVKAAKVSGMKPEDLVQLYKYGATPARLGGMSEETLLAFGGILKKANMGGDEAGVAFRALMAAAQSPTAGARTAMLAHGMNYKNYQKNPDHLEVGPFAENIAAKYGVKLSKDARAGLDRIFHNKAVIEDPAKFTPSVMRFLAGELSGRDAKSLKSVAGEANRYRSASMEGVDVNRFVGDLMAHLAGNLQFANAIFGSKQGGRIATALSDPVTFAHMLSEIRDNSAGYAEAISKERMSGFDGAVSRFEGAVKNLETAIGRAFDKDGKGGPLTSITNAVGAGVQKLAEWPSSHLMVGTGLAAAVSGLAGLGGMVNLGNLVFGGRLATSAAALNSAWLGMPYLTAAAGLGLGAYQLHEAAVENDGKSIGERRGKMVDVYRRSFNADRDALGIEQIPTPAGASTDISGARAPAKAEITGNADVKVNVEVKTETGFWSRISSAVSNAINNVTVHAPGGATGSTGARGASMPEATPTGGAVP